jgi:hypothetical protein
VRAGAAFRVLNFGMWSPYYKANLNPINISGDSVFCWNVFAQQLKRKIIMSLANFKNKGGINFRLATGI